MSHSVNMQRQCQNCLIQTASNSRCREKFLVLPSRRSLQINEHLEECDWFSYQLQGVSSQKIQLSRDSRRDFFSRRIWITNGSKSQSSRIRKVRTFKLKLIYQSCSHRELFRNSLGLIQQKELETFQWGLSDGNFLLETSTEDFPIGDLLLVTLQCAREEPKLKQNFLNSKAFFCDKYHSLFENI